MDNNNNDDLTFDMQQILDRLRGEERISFGDYGQWVQALTIVLGPGQTAWHPTVRRGRVSGPAVLEYREFSQGTIGLSVEYPAQHPPDIAAEQDARRCTDHKWAPRGPDGRQRCARCGVEGEDIDLAEFGM